MPGTEFRARGGRFFFCTRPRQKCHSEGGATRTRLHVPGPWRRPKNLFRERRDLSVTLCSRAFPGKGFRARGGRFFFCTSPRQSCHSEGGAARTRLYAPRPWRRPKNLFRERRDLSVTLCSRAMPGTEFRARGGRFFFCTRPRQKCHSEGGATRTRLHVPGPWRRPKNLFRERQDLSVTLCSRAMPGKGFRARGGRFFGRAAGSAALPEGPGRALPQNDRFLESQ
jgi:hypothetical protein